ncbi:MAG: C25 family cysteine peptidase [Bacteroidales bacterium]|jgi:hypothetical protein|nr:C25 family cysteine peptidase [Bacteroidales bacterium]
MFKHKFLRFAIFAILSSSMFIGKAQINANSWINYNQQYFKLKIAEDGIYKIKYSELLAAGIPVNTIDARGIQIIHKGEEQYIYIHGINSAGIFDPTGYIEFYGEKNRGFDDVAFFDISTNQLNNDYSMYSDTSAYFITWNYSTNNRRLLNQNYNNYEDYQENIQSFCWKKNRTNYTATYYDGSTQNWFSTSEGWFDNTIIGGSNNNVVTKNISLPNLVQNSENTHIELAVAGVPATNPTSTIPHSINIEFLGNIQTHCQFTGYQFSKQNYDIISYQLSTTLPFKFSSTLNNNDEYDRAVVSYIDITYPFSWNFPASNYTEFFLSPNNSSDKDYIQIKGFTSNSAVFLYDITNHARISVEKFSDTLKALVNNTDTYRKLVLVNQTGYKTVPKISKISINNKFSNYFSQFPKPNYIIITNSFLMSAAQEYAIYRRSTGYNVALLDIEQLYNQFGYGIDKHPIAIKNYFENLNEINPNENIYLLLLGKGIDTKLFRKNVQNYNNCIIPSAGSPACDVLLTAGIGNTTTEPFASTGRVSVSTNVEALSYLQKVISYENNEPAEWMKNTIFFGGGSNSSEQQNFANYLHNYASIISDTLFGGHTSTFLKTSSDPISMARSDSVEHLINGGTSIMTFFGHGHSAGFDQNIDFPENYNNYGKYPLMIANSCFSGDIFSVTDQVFSEIWVKAKNKGAIAYIATKEQSYAPYLNIFTEELFRNISYKKYHKTIAEQIKNTIKNLSLAYPNNLRIQNVYHDFTLNGDPAIIVNSHPKPDLLINNSDVFLIPNQLTTEIDSFAVKFIVKNIGRAITDTFAITIDRVLPNSENTTYKIFASGCLYSDTISFKIPINRLTATGLNTINIFVDSDNIIDELNENNNSTNISFIIKSTDVFPIFPYKYAIYPNKKITLIASSSDSFADNYNYKFQIDTSDSFNSPLLYDNLVNSSGGIISWELPFEAVENRVYFWRIAKNHNNSDSLVWKESSFVYEEGQEGWSQKQYYQFKENSFNMIDYNRLTQKFSFQQTPKVLHCHNVGNVTVTAINQIGWNIDGATNNGLGSIGNCNMNPAIIIVVIDPNTLLAWGSDRANYGHRNYPYCWSSSSTNFFFSFSTGNGTTVDYTGISDMTNMINSVPDGNYILAYSWANGYFQNWSENTLQTFENMGSTLIRNVTNSHPYIFFARKGQPTSAVEIVGTETNSIIDLPPVHLYTNFSYGNIKSIEIGPSMEWQSFHWFQEAQENPSYDTALVNIYGLTPQNNKQLIFENINSSTYDLYNLNQQIDYQQFPKLELSFFTKDDTTKTPAQLKKWQVKFKNVPETAIDPKLGFFLHNDTVQQGEMIKFGVATKNITPTLDMDSLMVKYWIQNQNNEIVHTVYKKLRPHPGNDILIDTIEFSTLDLSGSNSIWIEYNPINESTNTYYQQEQYHFNNIAVQYFFVKADKTNPLLDVSFDGKYIMNGELISSRPEILIKLKDENRFLELNDTSLFRMYLTNLQTGIETKLSFIPNYVYEYNIEWYPANLPNNSCKIILKPIFRENGDYRLRVQAKDVSGNWSASNDYIIEFKIITESSITHLLNYPNPFSTSTRFVFELTGYQIPDKMQIEIFTISGKLVRVISGEELGVIKIGKNITDFAWDGTDMYGDRLANGVYFYQVTTKIKNQDVELRATEADKYFKKEIGKMYLLSR